MEGTKVSFTSFISTLYFQAELLALANAGKIIAKALSDRKIPEGYQIDRSLKQREQFDRFAHAVIQNKLTVLPHKKISILISEESTNKIQLHKEDGYALAIDPLDGSKNMGVGLSVGTIFSIWPLTGSGSAGLGVGKSQLLAGYFLYGPSTQLVLAVPGRVAGFLLKKGHSGNTDFFLEQDDIKCPDHGSIYSVNESKYNLWSERQKKVLEWFKQTDKKTGRPYTSRYSGTLVADFHHILMKGGIYMYPANQLAPEGKIRYVYEIAPLSFICQAACGMASDGKAPALEMIPENIHDTAPIYAGSKADIKKAVELLAAT